MNHPLDKNIQQVLYTKEQLQQRIAELGKQISADYGDEEIVAICVLKGATPFCADLMRHITSPLVIDFMAASTYGGTSSSSGVVRFQKDIEEDVCGRNVLFIEDIIDSGLTLRYLTDHVRLRHPKSLKICCLMDKTVKRKTDLYADYVGFNLGDHFIVGYGFDYEESYRNMDYIGVMKPEAIHS
ncbi:MAG: hypoxanthine phosphoribosyltransferase [bacterium]|nr:hypoxanthine phosphoribosyltransferase [bacterium]